MTTGIYRTTEDGNQRVLEDSVGLRVTENYREGAATLVASSGFDFLGTLSQGADASLVASSTVTAVPTFIGTGASLLANNSILVAEARVIILADASLVAASSMLPDATTVLKGVSSMAASGSVTASGRPIRNASVVSGTLEFDRSTEEEDTRITEDGDVRITNFVTVNNIEGSMVANPTFIPFASTAYIKVNGVWQEVVDVDVKQQGDWGYLDKIYRNMSGKWKRIY